MDINDKKLLEAVNADPKNMELRFNLANNYLSLMKQEKVLVSFKLFEQNPH